MTLREALSEGHLRLLACGIDTPQLDASLLLAEALGATREHMLARLPDAVEETVLGRYRGFVERRVAGAPVSYIRGRKEFYSLSFAVGPGVLVPRPDTELLVDRARALAVPGGRAHDACTGSGCVAVALCHARPDLHVSASDLSPEAAAAFAVNCRDLLGRELPFFASDLLSSVPGTYDLLTANPPYLRDDEVAAMRASGWPEPAMALAGGADGLDLARRLIEQAAERLVPRGWLLLEADPDQMDRLAGCLGRQGFADIAVERDLGGRERVVEARWPG